MPRNSTILGAAKLTGRVRDFSVGVLTAATDAEEGRAAFYETLGRLATTLAHQGLVVLVAATAHRQAFREAARARASSFIEVYVETPAEVCRERAGGQLYTDEAIRGALPGAGVVYEPPERPDVRACGGDDVAAVDQVLGVIANREGRRRTGT